MKDRILILFFFVLFHIGNCDITIASDVIDNSNSRRLQFEGMFEQSAVVRTKNKSKNKAKTKFSVSSRASALQAFNEQVLLNIDRYHLWWTGPPEDNSFVRADWSASHRSDRNAVFSMAIVQGHNDRTATSSLLHDFQLFLGSLRRSVQSSTDVVMAIEERVLREEPRLQSLLQKHDAIVYTLSSQVCSNQTKSIFCGSTDERVPASVFRYFFYEKWASVYNIEAKLLCVDFRDVIFQSDPFVYHIDDWFPDHSLVVSQEFYPNMIIQRCHFNRMVMQECYGDEVLRRLGRKVIISSGGVLGSRDGILAWSHFMTQQLQEASGRQVETRCLSGGIEHSFVNYLIYGQKLRHLMRIKIFQQGDGPLNSLGGLRPDTVQANLTGNLSTFWKVLDKDGVVLNWDGSASPIVHQLDHYHEELYSLAQNQLLKGQLQLNDNSDLQWQALRATRCLWGCSD